MNVVCLSMSGVVQCLKWWRGREPLPAHEENSYGNLNNEDTPGTKSSDLPYAVAAEFLIALYAEAKKMIPEVATSLGRS